MPQKRPHDPALGPSQRQLRVAEEVRHALALLFERGDFRAPELAAARLTVTEVRASPDLKHMTAFVSGLGRDVPPATLAALRTEAPQLRGRLARQVRLKFAPELHFQPDTALDHAARMNALLSQEAVRRDVGKAD